MCFQSILLMTIFLNMNNLLKPIDKDGKYLSTVYVGSAPPSCFGTGSVFTTGEDGVLRRTPSQVFQRT